MASKKKTTVTYVDEETHTLVDEPVPQNPAKRPLRSRCFFIRTYIPPPALKRFLKSAPYIQHWIYINHDRDVHTSDDKLGELKESHCHVIVYFYEAKTVSAVQRVFDRYSLSITDIGDKMEKTHVEITNDKVSAFRYLLHLDDNQVKYEFEELVFDDWQYWSRFQYTDGMTDAVRNITLEIIDDMNKGVDYYTLIQRYGDYLTKNVKSIEHLRLRCWQERQQVEFEKNFAEILLNSAWFTPEDVDLFRRMLEYVNNAYISTTNRQLTFYLTAVNTPMEKFIQNHCITDGKKNQ